MAADFNKPVLTDDYISILEQLRQNYEVLARMFATGTTTSNIPVGSVRFDSGKFQTWSGSVWVDVPLSLDGGGTGAQNAAAARVALGTNDAANLTEGTLDAARVPGLNAAKIVSGTLTQDTSGNAATATYATSAGSATSAVVSDENRGSISAVSNTGSVTTTHTRQVNASNSSTASGSYSQVNAGDSSTASGAHTQVNVSSSSTALGNFSQVNASESSVTAASLSQVNASNRTTSTTSYSSAWGYASSGFSSPANQQIRLESIGGVGRFKGNTTTGGFDYAEYFPNLNNGVIPDGTIVTLVNEKVTPAQAGDFILGTVSATAGVIGNAPEFCWSGRFLKDEFGREMKQAADFVRWQGEGGIYDGLVSECDKPIPADATYYNQDIPITSPDYVDVSSDYQPRGERSDEWSIVGLMGQVYVRVYEDIEHNTYVSADGKQSETETRLYCMKMTTSYSSETGYGVAYCLLR